MERSSQNPYLRTRILGYSSYGPAEIVAKLRSGHRVCDIPGDFVVVEEAQHGSETQTTIVTSVLASPPYFVLQVGSTLLHGSEVMTLVARAKVPWRWNRRAILSIALFGHTIGSDTLHPQVIRVPPCSRLTFFRGTMSVETDPFWTDAFVADADQVLDPVEALDRVVKELTPKRPLVSLSGGFDSRAILAQVLAAGHRPGLLTMGRRNSTDRLIAEAIARDYGLEHLVVELKPDDYLRHAPSITRLTSGTKTASNWHTYLYARSAGELDAAPHLVGANGEFARTYYLDKGAVARVFNCGAAPALSAYFAAKVERRRIRLRDRLPLPELGSRSQCWQLGQLASSLCEGRGTALDCLDRFYALHRVRHFIGNGMALYNAHCPTVSPFLDARWIAAVAALARSEKLGSNHHRAVIARRAPRLLEYPIASEPTVAQRAPVAYWRPRRGEQVGYGAFAEVARNPLVTELLTSSDVLDDVVPKSALVRAALAKDPLSTEFLLTLHFAALEVRDARERIRSGHASSEADPR